MRNIACKKEDGLRSKKGEERKMGRDYCEAFHREGEKKRDRGGENKITERKTCLKREDDGTNGEKRKDGGRVRKRACVCIM